MVIKVTVMGVLQKLTQAIGLGREINLDDCINDMNEMDIMEEAADFYVKPIALEQDSDLELVKDELGQGNIVLLNITPLSRSPAKLKQMIESIKQHITTINGDIARLDEEKVLITPSRVKIVKNRKKR